MKVVGRTKGVAKYYTPERIVQLGQKKIETVVKYNGNWIKWLEDSRVGFTDRMARKYMRIANEFKEIGTTSSVLNNLSLNKLYTLASAPEEVKEEEY